MSGDAPDNAVASPMQWEPIDDKLLHEVWASDQAMYPAPELTFAHLKSLSDACPELTICLRGEPRTADFPSASESAVHQLGLIILWPLPAATHWSQLLDHTIQEHDVRATMFPPVYPDKNDDNSNSNSKDEKIPVGLHIFHIERFPAFQRARKGAGFTRLALEEVRQRVAKLEKTRSWDVVGYSALVATPEGFSAFTQLGFHSPNTEKEGEKRDHDSFSPMMIDCIVVKDSGLRMQSMH